MTDTQRPDTKGRLRNTNRMVLIGTTGAGKTTTARKIAVALNIPHIEFDAIRHGPNWTETPDDVFRERLRLELQGDRWVGDGNYGIARDVVWPRATMLVWLDLPDTGGHVEAVLEDDTPWSLSARTVARQ